VYSHGGPVRDHVSFVDSLRARQLIAEPVRQVKSDLLRGYGTVIALSGGTLPRPAELHSFNYDNTDLGTDGARVAEEDASRISRDGTSATTPTGVVHETYDGAPHFYRRERVIVLYIGDDTTVTGLLTELLGPQFAGR
jgi:hypothetical protein